MHRVIISVLLLFLLGVGIILYRYPRSAPVDPPLSSAARELITLIEDVPGAAAYRYQAADSAGHSMDTAKIIADPAGGYLAAYHAFNGQVFQTHLAASPDLLHWTYLQTYGDRTHQPYLTALPGGGFILVNETDNRSYNWIQVRYYASRAELLANRAARTIDLPHTLVPAGRWAEGTPNIYSATLAPDIDHSSIDIGFHYYRNGDVDRQGRGTLSNFTTWAAQAQPEIDLGLLAFGLGGNIGDRDHLIFRGGSFNLQEGQFTKNDFGSWRIFLWDWSTHSARRLAIRTHNGSQAFANPSLTLLPAPGGGQALIVTLFIPSENSAPGEAGELIYYRVFQP